jgi:hypothetical protein
LNFQGAASASGFTILFGDGQGGFPKRADYWQEVTGSIILADFDGDGKPDIIVGTGTAGVLTGPSMMVLFAGASGTFRGPPITCGRLQPRWPRRPGRRNFQCRRRGPA